MGLLRAVTPADLADVPCTYPEEGATADPVLPAGYRHSEHTVVVGRGREVFERTVAAVFAWRVQRSVGLRVRATGSPGEVGTVVVPTTGCRAAGIRTLPSNARRPTGGTPPGRPASVCGLRWCRTSHLPSR